MIAISAAENGEGLDIGKPVRTATANYSAIFWDQSYVAVVDF